MDEYQMLVLLSCYIFWKAHILSEIPLHLLRYRLCASHQILLNHLLLELKYPFRNAGYGYDNLFMIIDD